MPAKYKKQITPSDLGLWVQIVRNVQPLRNVKQSEDIKKPPKKTILVQEKTFLLEDRPVKNKNRNQPNGSQDRPSLDKLDQLDGALQRRLKRGEIRIAGRLDLHGYTRADAHARLLSFLHQAHQAQDRCILVITGKGREQQSGVLQREVPIWLNSEEMRRIVLAFCHAQKRDGGVGALYILIRRKRSEA